MVNCSVKVDAYKDREILVKDTIKSAKFETLKFVKNSHAL